MEVKLELTLDEVNGILGVLGELPSKTGVWPLIGKIQSQVAPQVQTAQESAAPAPALAN